ncbi:MAG: T9SS type A sorting domain-containing protein [Bacteroidetes bacterium]|nr:T9SS type A sorting domain-containing protein [Bacteroidota bacterium]
MRKPWLIFSIGAITFLTFSDLYGQSGCTDPEAVNYDPDATENDGSCEYPPTSLALEQVTTLPPELIESSGLAFIDGKLWTHNDGGNEDELYRIDSLNGNILQDLNIATAINIDWEDLAQDQIYIYIADFGNNSGNRQDLVIYRILQSDMSGSIANADAIQFSYEDQTDFSSAPFATNFDCEAVLFHNDSLHLFTKHWLDYKTKHYVLAAEPGEQTAWLRDSLDANLLITAADKSETGEILLLGWNPVTGNAAMWLLFDYAGHKLLNGNKRRINLGFASENSQPEGLVFTRAGSGFISSENFLSYPQKLLKFEVGQWTDGLVSTKQIYAEALFRLSPNPGSQQLCIETVEGQSIAKQTQLKIYDLNGRLVFEQEGLEEKCLNTYLPPSMYLVILKNEERREVLKWINTGPRN